MKTGNITVLRKILYAVESGGQIYGNQNYSAFAGVGANTPNEKAITIGAGQWYAGEAKMLLQNIQKKYPTEFSKLDAAGITADLKKSWDRYGVSATSAKGKSIIAIISSSAGIKCQDELMETQIAGYAASIAKTYGTMTDDAMMECINIIHQGGASALKRILAKTAKPYTAKTIYAALCTDPADKSSNNQVGDYVDRQKKVYEFITKYADFSKNSGVTNGGGENKNIMTYEKYINSTGTHYISNSGSDENGGYHGGKAGDQTGREWQLRSWYSRPWNCVLRHPKEEVGMKLAELACAAALNDLIGYDQNQREAYWQHLKASNYDPSQITIACEADCSAGVIANVRAAGYLLGIDALKNLSASYTGNMRSGLKAAGFQVLTDSKYLTSGNYLIPGDILLNDTHHTATNVTKGKLAKAGSTPAENTSTSTNGGKYMFSVGNVQSGSKGNDVKLLQRLLKSNGFKGKDGKNLSIDGECGANTIYAIKAYQTKKGLSVDGCAGPATWKSILLR